MIYGVWCRVSGGVTGTRESWLKANDRIAVFDDEESAQAEARRLNAMISGNPHRKASFHYAARPLEGDAT